MKDDVGLPVLLEAALSIDRLRDADINEGAILRSKALLAQLELMAASGKQSLVTDVAAASVSN